MFQDPYDTLAPTPRRKYYGKYKGFVRDNADPEGRSRIRCYCPQVMGDIDHPDYWLSFAEANHPWLGGISVHNGGPPLTAAQAGEEVGVWLEFEGGEVDFPIWTGTFVVAPTRDLGDMDLTATEGATGGSILPNPPSGSNTADFTPPKPLPDAKELRILVPKGIDIVLMSDSGGSVTIGPNGVIIEGPFVYINGKSVVSDLGNVSG